MREICEKMRIFAATKPPRTDIICNLLQAFCSMAEHHQFAGVVAE